MSKAKCVVFAVTFCAVLLALRPAESSASRVAADGPVKRFLNRFRYGSAGVPQEAPYTKLRKLSGELSISCPNSSHTEYAYPTLYTCGKYNQGADVDVIGTLLGGTLPEFVVGETKEQPTSPGYTWHVEFTNLEAAEGITFRCETVDPFFQEDYGTFDLTSNGHDCSTTCPPIKGPVKDKKKDGKMPMFPEGKLITRAGPAITMDPVRLFQAKQDVVFGGGHAANQGRMYALLIKLDTKEERMKPKIDNDRNPVPLLYRFRFETVASGKYLLRVRSQAGGCWDYPFSVP